jgi:hypothetical protein
VIVAVFSAVLNGQWLAKAVERYAEQPFKSRPAIGLSPFRYTDMIISSGVHGGRIAAFARERLA